MNDHKFIRTSDGAEFPKPFTPVEAYKRHLSERRWLTDRLSEEHDGPTVCITHHAPHPGSLHPRYADAEAMNASFISDLSDVIAEYRPTLWIHGHVHDNHDYAVGGDGVVGGAGGDGTRIVCNPAGYAWEPNTGFIPDLVVEIPEWSPRPRFR